MMVGVGGTSKTGKVHYYYKCGNRIYKKSCDKKPMKKDLLERQVVFLAKEYVLNDDIISNIADSVVEYKSRETPLFHICNRSCVKWKKGLRICSMLFSKA